MTQLLGSWAPTSGVLILGRKQQPTRSLLCNALPRRSHSPPIIEIVSPGILCRHLLVLFPTIIYFSSLHSLTIKYLPYSMENSIITKTALDGNIDRNRRYPAHQCPRMQKVLQRRNYRSDGLVPLATRPQTRTNPFEVLWEQFGSYIRHHNFLTGNTLNPVYSKSIHVFFFYKKYYCLIVLISNIC